MTFLRQHRDLRLNEWNAGWPGEIPDKLTTRIPPPYHSLHKSVKVADYYVSSNHSLPYRYLNHYSTCAVDQSLWLYTFLVKTSSPPSCPTAPVGTWLLGNTTHKESQPLSESPPFCTSLLCPQLRKAAKQSQPPSQFPGPSLGSCICLMKIVWKFFWGFFLILRTSWNRGYWRGGGIRAHGLIV